MKKLAGVGKLAIILLILLLPKLIFPSLIASELERAVRNELKTADITVQVSSNFGWELFLGRISFVEITARDGFVSDIPVEYLHMVGEDVQINTMQLLRAGEFIYAGAKDLQVNGSLSEQGLNEYFWGVLNPERTFRFQLVPDEIILTGTLGLLNVQWDIRALGTLVIRDSYLIQYVPQELVVDQTRVPRLLLEIISENYGVVLDFSDLPVDVKLQEVQIEEGRMLLRGQGTEL